MINTLFSNPLVFILSMIALTVSLTIHEFSHAFAADSLGDPTPRLRGRLSLNPLVHIDLMGLAFLLFAGFGWGKPVEFDPYNLKNPRKDAALISFAGPLSNFILAIVCSIIIRLLLLLQHSFLVTIGLLLLYPMVIISISLGIFNLLPIHPLDGFKIVGGILSEEKAREWQQLERYGMIFLILLIIPIGSASLLNVLHPVVDFIINLLIPSSFGQGII